MVIFPVWIAAIGIMSPKFDQVEVLMPEQVKDRWQRLVG
jgi:hypothetical protein